MIDGGLFAAKAISGQTVTVTSKVYADGHDKMAVNIRWRAADEENWHSAPANVHRHLVMPIGVDLAGHRHRLPADRLGRKQPTVNHRQRVFDHDAGQLQRLGE
ncbi:membrane protein [Pseudomonas syringae pv. spinaceae]|uniref:Membrane protein n=1 Tax=Pseudomonas syringae pv. spinaceae TaxID=264459 RepID=A0A0N8SVF1_PSESX|nr:membrane protein [Pseudomonas syringae pv. spinaceae]